MSWLTDAQILSAVADCLQVAGGSAALAPYWTNIVARQHAYAYQTILSALLNRGFLLEQILPWDQGPYFEQQLSEFFVFTDSASTHTLDLDVLKLRDLRKELTTVLVTVNNVFIKPGATGDEPGTVGTGPQVDDGTSLFPWPQARDGGPGQNLRRERW